ncbi:hypothetical protein CONPUDRAFT_76620 [Coniophora puteana RWD-64-598 SS2]|uniref:Uncharacterized protein n=1 Tax=Coniophora puteana (strain RWD-64-598) TaxID=741705 RepID=A0A5M3MB50_CONPW|nr:uncharacterized protein CONPUDRAFT_76620 [Coniophora puteana RWD-64-598 SS2]EIW76226.1 hypothetical protein CONPUDRAFT_76620 [Coniophora puteana RWD-64-598 SS2]
MGVGASHAPCPSLLEKKWSHSCAQELRDTGSDCCESTTREPISIASRALRTSAAFYAPGVLLARLCAAPASTCMANEMNHKRPGKYWAIPDIRRSFGVAQIVEGASIMGEMHLYSEEHKLDPPCCLVPWGGEWGDDGVPRSKCRCLVFAPEVAPLFGPLQVALSGCRSEKRETGASSAKRQEESYSQDGARDAQGRRDLPLIGWEPECDFANAGFLRIALRSERQGIFGVRCGGPVGKHVAYCAQHERVGRRSDAAAPARTKKHDEEKDRSSRQKNGTSLPLSDPGAMSRQKQCACISYDTTLDERASGELYLHLGCSLRALHPFRTNEEGEVEVKRDYERRR